MRPEAEHLRRRLEVIRRRREAELEAAPNPYADWTDPWKAIEAWDGNCDEGSGSSWQVFTVYERRPDGLWYVKSSEILESRQE